MSAIEREDFSANLFSVASRLTNPICVAHEKYALVTLPKSNTIYPDTGKMDSFHYGAYIASNIAQSIFLFAVGVPLAAVGALVRFTAIQISPNNFTYVSGRGEEKVFQWPFTILKWNICGIGGGFPIVQNGLKLWNDRVEKIVEKVTNADADMVFLEEVYDYKLGEAIIEKLKETYPHFYFNTGPKIVGAPMGLLVASKFKIDKAEFSYYPASTNLGKIKFVGKGMFSCRIGEEVFFLHSHLQHSEEKVSNEGDKSDRRIQEENARRAQVALIKEKLPEDNARKVFLGDLNMEKNEMQHLKIFDLFQEPLDIGSTYFPMDTLVDPNQKPDKSFSKSIDHCLIDHDNGRDAKQVQIEIVEAFDLDNPTESISDHNGLKVTVS